MASSFPAHQICILSCLLPGNRIEERIDCKQRPFHVKWSFYFSTLKLETVDIKVYALDERLKYRCNKTSRKRKVHMDVHFVCLLKIASIYVVLPDDDSCRDNASGGSCRAVAHFFSMFLICSLRARGDRNLLRSTCSCKKIQSPVKISFSG